VWGGGEGTSKSCDCPHQYCAHMLVANELFITLSRHIVLFYFLKLLKEDKKEDPTPRNEIPLTGLSHQKTPGT
jgi:hypothetical protein